MPIGTPVQVIDQAIKVGWSGGELYVEAHPEERQADELEWTGQIKSFGAKSLADALYRIKTEAGAAQHRLDWRLVRRVFKERSGVPVQGRPHFPGPPPAFPSFRMAAGNFPQRRAGSPRPASPDFSPRSRLARCRPADRANGAGTRYAYKRAYGEPEPKAQSNFTDPAWTRRRPRTVDSREKPGYGSVGLARDVAALPAWRSTRPGSLPRTALRNWRPAGKARYAQRKWLSWIKEVLDSDDSLRGLAKVRGEWDLVCLALNIKRMGRVALRQVLACQRTCSGARSAHRPRMKRESLPFRPSGQGFPSQSRAGQMSTLGPKSHLSGGRAPIAQHQNFYGARS